MKALLRRCLCWARDSLAAQDSTVKRRRRPRPREHGECRSRSAGRRRSHPPDTGSAFGTASGTVVLWRVTEAVATLHNVGPRRATRWQSR